MLSWVKKMTPALTNSNQRRASKEDKPEEEKNGPGQDISVSFFENNNANVDDKLAKVPP